MLFVLMDFVNVMSPLQVNDHQNLSQVFMLSFFTLI